MFTDMGCKPPSNEQIRLELSLKQESATQSQAGKMSALESTTGNFAGVRHTLRQNYHTRFTPLKSNISTPRSFLVKDLRSTTKQQQHSEQSSRTIAKSKQKQQLQRALERSSHPPIKVAPRHYQGTRCDPVVYDTKAPKMCRKTTRGSKITNVSTSGRSKKDNNQFALLKEPQILIKRPREVMPRHDICAENIRSNVTASNTSQGYSREIPLGNEYIGGNITDTFAKRSMEIPPIEYNPKEEYIEIRQQVDTAIKDRKIFLIRGDIPYLENALKKRGWVQKYECSRTRNVPYGSVASLDAPSLGTIHLPNGNLNEKAIIFHMLRHVPPDFIWDCRNEFVDWSSHVKADTILNRFQKSFVYTSKLGMATILEDAHWYHEEGVASVQCPRSYNVRRDRNAFIDDYRRTAAVSLLKWFSDQMERGVDLTKKGPSLIPSKQIEFAIRRCEEILMSANNEYLDAPEISVSPQEWESFLADYINAVHQGYGVADQSHEVGLTETGGLLLHSPLQELNVSAMRVLAKIKDLDAQYELNGVKNIWILKPSDLCCGSGIIMSHKLGHVMRRVQDSAKDYFIVQKYIERPLLVKDTKFDVRQWYLVTKSYPLTVWIYNSKPFTLANYHEAVHICNTAVQSKYCEQKNSVRSQDWDCAKINDYLKKSGYTGEPWYDRICPKMYEAIIATMLAAQQHMDRRRNSFELYGADFMIMDDLSVWLIEINTNPRIHPPSTRVSERLYPAVLESLVKVILDYPSNPNADTGDFFLAYQQKVTAFQPYSGACMYVLGKTVSSRPTVFHRGMPVTA